MFQIKMFTSCFILFAVFILSIQSVYSETEIKRIWFSTRGIECRSPCATKGEKFNWCSTVALKSDYCSTSPLVDYNGKKCESKCGHNGQSYKWCWTNKKDKEWGYCSRESKEVLVKHFGSTEGKECSSTCDKHGHSYYWCRLEKSEWDYCSPDKGKTSAGNKCKNKCGKQTGTSYTWCYDENSKWQYCSPVEILTGKGPVPFQGNSYTPPPTVVFQTLPSNTYGWELPGKPDYQNGHNNKVQPTLMPNYERRREQK